MKLHCVVLADSHQNMLEGIRGLLEAMFETVVMVADETSLFEALDKIKPALAVVDFSLPVSGEVHIVRQLNTLYPNIKLIVLSVNDEPELVRKVMSAGTSGFVLKRSAGTDLPEAIDSVLLGNTFVSPSVGVRINNNKDERIENIPEV